MKKRFLYLFLFVCLLISFISCAQESSRNATVSFHLSSKTLEALARSASPSSSMRAGDVAEDQGEKYKGIVTLYVDGQAQEQEFTKTKDDYEAIFSAVPVGSRAKAKAEIFRDEKLVASGVSSEITITEGDNSLKITLKKDDGEVGLADNGGSIELELILCTIKKNTTLSSAKFFQNYGKLVLSFLDEEGKDLFADIDWDNSTNKTRLENMIQCKAKYKSTEFDVIVENNTISLDSAHPLPFTGYCQLLVTVAPPENLNYKTKEGEYAVLPAFEYTSSAFEITVEEGIVIDVGLLHDLGEDAEYEGINVNEDLGGYHTYNTLLVGINNILRFVDSSDKKLILIGETDLSYEDFAKGVFNITALFSGKYDIDMSGVTTENDSKVMIGEDTINGFEPLAESTSTELISIIFPEDMTELGENAFKDNSTLTSVKFGNETTKIGDSAFNNCSKLVQVTFGDGLTTIGEDAFNNYQELTQVTFGDGLTEICDNAFNNCSELTQVTFGSGLTTIGKDAFCDSGLTEVAFPSGLREIGSGAFYRCNFLSQIEFPADSNLRVIGASAFSMMHVEELIIPESVIAIGAMAFYRMNGEDSEGLSFADSSGNWYYAGNSEVTGKTQWETWISGTQTPPDHDENVPFGEESDILNAVKNSSESNVYWFCVKD